MVMFTGELVLQQDTKEHTPTGRAEWISAGVLNFVDDDGSVITFGQGARTDLGSTPQIVWSLGFPPDGMGVEGYVIHDLLYRTKGTCEWTGLTWRTRKAPYTRAEADEILRKALIVCGVPAWRARIIWLAVRAGGGFAWGT